MKTDRFLGKAIGVMLACLMIGATFGGIGLTPDARAGEGTITAVTPYPFSDDVENPAANNWVADTPPGAEPRLPVTAEPPPGQIAMAAITGTMQTSP